MFVLKCLLLLFIFGDIDAVRTLTGGACPYPHIDHGRVRSRQKSKLIKFICFPGYTLVGNRYATCRDGDWDVPIPVCVKPGCPPLPKLVNGLDMRENNGAWVVCLCYPGYQMQGSPVLYCDGRRWNGTMPTCQDSTVPPKLSCDFEDPNLCGWMQDELHDFDWRRMNKKTPSSFLFTGPSYDHTLGEFGLGYYMYVESTSRIENETARLLSPLYSEQITQDGCFSFWYHMYGKTIGGLRVYQKPTTLTMENLLQISDEFKQKYLLFEKWGNLGDKWYNEVVMLKSFDVDFQIVIEGVRGSSFTSDIAIDDVAIVRGENCSSLIKSAVTPTAPTTPYVFKPYSCEGRCQVHNPPANNSSCSCVNECVNDSNCCADFFYMCIFNDEQNDMVTDVTTEHTSEITTATTELSVNTPTVTIPIVVSTTRRPTTQKVIRTTKLTTTTPKTTTSPTTSTTKIIKLTTKPIVTTTMKPIPTTKIIPKTTQREEKHKRDERISQPVISSSPKEASQSSGMKKALLAITGILCCAAAVWGVMFLRGEKGKTALARLRGRALSDPEVRYLNEDTDY